MEHDDNQNYFSAKEMEPGMLEWKCNKDNEHNEDNKEPVSKRQKMEGNEAGDEEEGNKDNYLGDAPSYQTFGGLLGPSHRRSRGDKPQEEP